jgi:hypothetical protein
MQNATLPLTGAGDLSAELGYLLLVPPHQRGVVQHFVDLGAILDLLGLAGKLQS